MEKSDEESESTVVAKVSKSSMLNLSCCAATFLTLPAPDLQGNADTYAVKGYGKSGNDKIKKPDLDVQKGRKRESVHHIHIVVLNVVTRWWAHHDFRL
jgi:hypothetical protein